MNYQKAKELKEAGFPQDEENLKCACNFIKSGEEPTESVYDCNTERVYDPSLDELIEACGDNILRIDFLHDINEVIAYGRREDTGVGVETKEAVTNLWLALNKK